MFRCFPRPGGTAPQPIWLQPLAHGSSSRGMKLSAILPPATRHQNSPRSGPKPSQEGRYRLEELSSHNIGSHHEMKTARKLRWGSIDLRIGHRHTVQRYDMDCFAGYGRAYTEAVCRRYMAENARPLWWSAKLVNGQSPVVRNKGSSRMNVAFRGALRDAGYDVEGWRVGDPEGGQQGQMWRRKIVQLYGTVEIAAHQVEMLSSAKFSDLQAHFARVVKGLEEELGKTLDGSRAAPGQDQPARGDQGRGISRGGSEQRGGRPDQRGWGGPEQRGRGGPEQRGRGGSEQRGWGGPEQRGGGRPEQREWVGTDRKGPSPLLDRVPRPKKQR